MKNGNYWEWAQRYAQDPALRHQFEVLFKIAEALGVTIAHLRDLREKQVRMGFSIYKIGESL